MNNYAKGAGLERKIVKAELRKGNLSTRTPQSRGFFDILIITRSKERKVIQAKKFKMSPKERQDAIDKFLPFADVLKANDFKCYLLEHYDREDHYTDITNEVYQ